MDSPAKAAEMSELFATKESTFRTGAFLPWVVREVQVILSEVGGGVELPKFRMSKMSTPNQ